MNSTARHCEAIMYDYFDYFEKYELSYKSLNNLKEHYSKIIDAKKVNLDDGSLKVEDLVSEEALSEFNRVVLNFTRQNVNKVKVVYAEHLRKKDNDYQLLEKEKESEKKKHEQAIEKLKREYEGKLTDEKARHKKELEKLSVSLEIGNTVREWIRKEADRHLSEMLSYMIINNINGLQKNDDDFRVGKMMRGENEDEIADGDFESVTELSQSIMEDYKKSASDAENTYVGKFREAIALQDLFEGALDDVLKLDAVKNVVKSLAPLGDKNKAIRDTYNENKLNRKIGRYNLEEESELNESVKSDTDDIDNE